MTLIASINILSVISGVVSMSYLQHGQPRNMMPRGPSYVAGVSVLIFFGTWTAIIGRVLYFW